MSINQNEWTLETAKLEEVCGRIRSMLKDKQRIADEYKEDVIEIRRSMWDNTSHIVTGEFDEVVEILQYINLMKQEEKHHQHTNEQIKKLEKMLEAPYFARIDFEQADYDETENIYIGMMSLIDNDTMDIIVYDWRAPISSIYYEYELGDASYEVGNREIKGQVNLKRQYKIARSTLLYMFDSSIKIDDEILQEILSKSADDKMKNIVISIQKEQNNIIRDESTRVLIVQGAAGSGKTSIALHRIAYLLYRHRDDGFNSGNVVIFSPNQIFNDYISDVLPELGEENVHQTTFYEYLRSHIGKEYAVESMLEQMEYMMGAQADRNYKIRKEAVDFKGSIQFAEMLDKYIEKLDSTMPKFRDIDFNGMTLVTNEQLEQLYSKDYRSWPILTRLAKIKDRVLYLMEPLKEKRLKEIQKQLEDDQDFKGNVVSTSRAMIHSEMRAVREGLEQMTKINTFDLFVKFFEDSDAFKELGNGSLPDSIFSILNYTIRSLRSGKLFYEDAVPYMYFKGALEGSPQIADIRHVVIDEAQDYSYMQYQIIRRLFKYASFTILGDVNQAINTFMHTVDYQKAAEMFGDLGTRVMTLTKSYRSTKEIWEVAEKVLPSHLNQQPVSRSGDKPQVAGLKDRDALLQHTVAILKDQQQQNMKSIAVICKTAKQCEELFGSIKNQLQEVNLITSENAHLHSGISILPSYLAKGLEFDSVIIFEASEVNYKDEGQRKLMYTMCTRALHKLYILYTGKMTPLLSEVDDKYAELI